MTLEFALFTKGSKLPLKKGFKNMFELLQSCAQPSIYSMPLKTHNRFLYLHISYLLTVCVCVCVCVCVYVCVCVCGGGGGGLTFDVTECFLSLIIRKNNITIWLWDEVLNGS